MRSLFGREVLSFDRWRAATDGLVDEVIRQDTVFYTSLVEATALDELRRLAVLRGEARPSYTALVIKAISLALGEHPEMNRLVLGGLYRHRPVQLHCVDAVVARNSFYLSMGYDHRLTNGGPAARFFRGITARLETAELDEARQNSTKEGTEYAEVEGPVRGNSRQQDEGLPPRTNASMSPSSVSSEASVVN